MMPVTKKRPVLIITSEPDPHADAVMKHLKEAKVPVVRINSNRLGVDLNISYESLSHTYKVNVGNKSYLLEEFRSIWYRKPDFWWDDHRSLTGEQGIILTYKYQEVMGLLANLMVEAELKKIHTISPLSKMRRASYKLVQSEYAKNCGFTLPATYVGLSPTEIGSFIQANPRVVTKSVNATNVQYGKHQMVLKTNEFNYADLKHTVEKLNYPILIQEKIEKTVELRITVVGSNVFTCSIDSQTNESTRLDWRNADPYTIKHAVYDLPKHIERSCISLCRVLGLNYAAIDMAVTPDEKYIFFEINPNGQYLWIEQLTHLPISRALARLLKKSAN